MSYDPDLAERVCAVLAVEVGLAEQRMFGGLALTLDGRMAVAASGNGGLIVRTLAGETEQLLARPGVAVVEMRGRPMNNWLRVDTEQLREDGQLREWVAIGVAAARAQPPKA